MAHDALPLVIDDRLLPSDRLTTDAPAIQVGSPAWYAWLNEHATRSFAFHSSHGRMTVRREYRHGSWYWYAYRSLQGHLYKTYLGKSEELTTVRLHEAADVLSTKSATQPQPQPHPQPPHMLRTLSPPATAPLSPATGTPALHVLMTKLSVPPARPNTVLRQRLLHQMNAAVRGPLTLVRAPAGWGKTTLLSSWHADPGGNAWPLAWVSLEASDNDSNRFWTYIITALNLAHPGVGALPLTLLQATPPIPTQVVLTSLLNAQIALSTETVLVLDDYHLIEAEGIHDALSYFVEHLPATIHLIIASRHDPPFPLARLRGQGLLSEVRADHLRFTVQETTTYLTEVMGLPLSSAEVATLHARTEGWIAGLHLAVLSLQGRADVADVIAAFSGSQRYVADYLIEEVLVHQRADIQAFLLQTCILDRLSAPLCDAVREQSGSQSLLESIERTNPFLVALDDGQHWYRFHHLFAEVLRCRLQQQQPTLIPELHRRASRWFEQHDLPDEAITHALAVPENERAAHLIELRAQSSTFPCNFQTVLMWLNRLPAALIRMRPVLCILHALVLLSMNHVEEASARLHDAEGCLQEGMSADERQAILGQVAALRSQVARSIGDSKRCVTLAQQALDLLQQPQETSLLLLLYALARVNALYTYLVDGEVTLATEQRAQATAASVRASGDLVSVLRSMSNLARLQVLQGRLRQAGDTYAQAVQLFRSEGDLQTLLGCPMYSFGLGDLLREWNELEIAEHHLRQGIALDWGPLLTDVETVTGCYLALARLQQARGEHIQALETLDMFAHSALRYRFVSHLVSRGAAVRAQVQLAQGNLTAALQWAESSGLSAGDEPSYPREQEYLTLVRVRIAQRRAHSRDAFLREEFALLERLLEDAERKARMRSAIEIRVLCALALQAQGKLQQALSALGETLALAEPEGYIRLFLDEGLPMLVLLREARVRQITPGYEVTLLEAAGELVLPTPYRSSQLLESLTAREREVLRLLVDGASNREIAMQLVLSINTVKKHVFNVCGKLGVQRRTQAIAKARTLQLL